MYKILIITGEPSGDNLGSKLIKEMKIQFDEKVDSNNFQNKKLLFQGKKQFVQKLIFDHNNGL